VEWTRKEPIELLHLHQTNGVPRTRVIESIKKALLNPVSWVSVMYSLILICSILFNLENIAVNHPVDS